VLVVVAGTPESVLVTAVEACVHVANDGNIDEDIDEDDVWLKEDDENDVAADIGEAVDDNSSLRRAESNRET
jgi:hypothetical protein